MLNTSVKMYVGMVTTLQWLKIIKFINEGKTSLAH